jgi:hypothetical protein
MRTLIRTTDGYFLRDGESLFALGDIAAAELMDVIAARNYGAPTTISGDVLSPVNPDQMFLVGINYPSHAAEVGMDIPTCLGLKKQVSLWIMKESWRS